MSQSAQAEQVTWSSVSGDELTADRKKSMQDREKPLA